MNFSSLKEYFFKLYNAAMRRMLLPLAAFLGIYYLFLSELIMPFIQDELLLDIMLFGYPVIISCSLTIVHLGNRRLLKSRADLAGLGNKLDLFYQLTARKMKAASLTSLFAATGFLVTGHEWFSLYFAGIILWFTFQWPTPRKVCNQLKLKGDERKMVMTKGEAFRF